MIPNIISTRCLCCRLPTTASNVPHNYLPLSYPASHPGRTKCVIRTVLRVSLAGGPGLIIAQSRTVGSDKWRSSVLPAFPRHASLCSGGYKSMKHNNKNLKIPQDLPAASVARQFEDRFLDKERPIVVDNPPQSHAAGSCAPRAQQGHTRGRQ